MLSIPTSKVAAPPHAEASRWSALSPSAKVVSGASAAVLRRIREVEVGLAVWQRRLPQDLGAYLASLPLEELGQRRVTLRPDEAATVARVLTAAWTSRGQAADRRPGAAFLRQDIARLVVCFAAIAAAPWVRLRLEAVTGDACRFFHADHVPLRLVTTYLGAGTEVLPSSGVHFEGARLRLDPAQAWRLAAGHVGLFKGLLWDGESGQERWPILHRSPPIAGSGETRVLLVLDRAAEPV